MREFEKWYSKEIRPYIHNPGDKAIVKKGWKESLLWFLKVAEHLSPTDCALLNEELGNG